MMRTTLFLILTSFIGTASLSTAVYAEAEIFRGEITRTGIEGSSFDLKFENSAKQKQQIQVWVSTETQFKGLSSLLELVRGDEVVVVAQQNKVEDDRWEADIVELSKVVIRDPGPEVSASKEIVEEKVDREQAAEIPNQDIEIAALRARFDEIKKEVETLQTEVAKTKDNLQEKKDMLMGELLKKKIMTEAKLNEYETADAESRNEIFKAASLLMTDLEESLLRARQELLKMQS